MVRGEIVKVCIYFRCSSFTVNRYQQKLDALTEYVNKQANWALSGVYYDLDNCKEPSYAPDLQKMFDEIDQYNFNVLVIGSTKDFGSFARTRMDAQRHLREKGVRLIVLDRVLGMKRDANRSDPNLLQQAVEKAELRGDKNSDQVQRANTRKNISAYLKYLKGNRGALLDESGALPYKHCIHIQIGGRMLVVPLTEDNFDIIYNALIDMQ